MRVLRYQLNVGCMNVLRLPPMSEVFSPIVNIIPLQLLAYHVADLRGCDVDHPRNLAKSVTVECPAPVDEDVPPRGARLRGAGLLRCGDGVAKSVSEREAGESLGVPEGHVSHPVPRGADGCG